ncbi:MAG: tetratricopeptide repeat protein, partial [Desulfobacteraceae bacterium]|nr:tetratricopeptide repeat protein [Desulfobacteraceae bacterium]
MTSKQVPIQQAVNIGCEHYKSGNTDAAEKIFKNILSVDPDNVDANHLLGIIEKDKGHFEHAVKLISKAIRIDPDQAVFYNHLGIVLKEMEKLPDAIQNFKKAINLNPDYCLAFNNLGDAYIASNRFDRAIAALKNAISIKPDYVSPYCNLGVAFKAQENFKRAIASLTKALALDPNHAKAHNNLGDVYKALNLMEKAVEHYKQAISIQPSFLTAICNLAHLYEKTNQLDKSQDTIQKALSIDQHDPLANCLLATILRRQKEYNDALNVLSGIKIPTTNTVLASRIHYEFGKTYDYLDTPQNAFDHFNRANRFSADNRFSAQADKSSFVKQIHQNKILFSKEYANLLPADRDKDLNPPIFIVGFPRSGTTLLDQIIGSHPEVLVVEEKPMLEMAMETSPHFSLTDAKPDTPISDQEIKALQASYFKHLRTCTGKHTGKKIIVDKYPLNLVSMGCIHTLFPRAKIIMCLRHP